jgi:hypothetical protein
MLTDHYDVEFVRAEVARLADEQTLFEVFGPAAAPYFDGLTRSLGWLAGTHASPLSRASIPPDQHACDAEYRTARLMVEDPQRGYDGLDPSFVQAVYRVLRWVRATPEARELLVDPLVYR